MNRQEHLLTIAAEECAEVAVRLSKAKRFGMHEIQPGQPLNNRERIVYELNDLLTVLAMADVIEIDHEGCVSVDAAMQGEKERKVERYLLYSSEVGTLTGLLGYMASTNQRADALAPPEPQKEARQRPHDFWLAPSEIGLVQQRCAVCDLRSDDPIHRVSAPPRADALDAPPADNLGAT